MSLMRFSSDSQLPLKSELDAEILSLEDTLTNYIKDVNVYLRYLTNYGDLHPHLVVKKENDNMYHYYIVKFQHGTFMGDTGIKSKRYHNYSFKLIESAKVSQLVRVGIHTFNLEKINFVRV